MEFFKHNTKIDFMAQRKWTALLSAILFVLSIVSFTVNGLNWGLDFTGGTQIQLNFSQTADLNQIRDNLEKAGFKERSEEHTSELQSHSDLVCRLLLEKKNIYIRVNRKATT